jgi:hypothetical protein
MPQVLFAFYILAAKKGAWPFKRMKAINRGNFFALYFLATSHGFDH